MSFFSDLFHGNFGNLGNDLNPSNAFSDFGSDAMKVLSNPIADVGIAASVALPFLAPEILPGVFGAEAATDVAAGGAASFGAASDAFDIAGGLGPGGVTAADFADAAPGFGGLTDAQIAALQSSPGASAFGASPGGAFGGAGTATAMGGGGDLDPAVAAATGAPAGGTAVSAAPAAPSFAQDLTQQEILAGTGVGGGSPVGAFGPSGAAAGGGNALTDTLSGIGNFLSSPAGKGATAVAGLGGLGVNLVQGAQQAKELRAMNQQEQQNIQSAQNAQAAAMSSVGPLLNNGTLLTTYLANNTLPPQFQSQIDQWVQSTKAAITQGYASRNPGGNVTPQNNSALQQDLANVDQQALGLKANFEEILSSAGQQMIQTANQLISTGLSATSLASEIPLAVSRLNQSLNAQMSNAISNFAAAINGGNRGVGGPGTLTLNLNPATGAIQ